MMAPKRLATRGRLVVWAKSRRRSAECSTGMAHNFGTPRQKPTHIDLREEKIKTSSGSNRTLKSAQEVVLFQAWQAEIQLNKLKALIGHGNWHDWVEANFCKPRGVEYRAAVLYLKIDKANPQLRDVKKPNVRHVAHLQFDTI